MVQILRVIAMATLGLTTTAMAQWSHYGKDEFRNSRGGAYGPDRAQLIWSFEAPSRTADQPFSAYFPGIYFSRSPVPPEQEAGRPVVFSIDQEDGTLRWSVPIPYEPGQGPAVVMCTARDIYVSRSTPESPAFIYRLDSETGAITWTSNIRIAFDPREGALYKDYLYVSTPDRVHHFSTHGAWDVPRTAAAGGYTGATIVPVSFLGIEALCIVDAAPGGVTLRKLNRRGGGEVYRTGVMPAGSSRYPLAFAKYNGDFVLPLSSTDPVTSRVYAIRDTGTEFVPLWSAPIGYSLGGGVATLSDGSYISIGPGNVLERLSVVDGSVMVRSATIAEYPLRPSWAVESRNVIYMSTGTGPSGRLYAFDSGLNEYFPPVSHPGIGGIAMLGSTLIVADASGIHAYRTPPMPPPPEGCPPCAPDYDQSGGQDGDDIWAFFQDWERGLPCADLDNSNGIDMHDLFRFMYIWERGSCP